MVFVGWHLEFHWGEVDKNDKPISHYSVSVDLVNDRYLVINHQTSDDFEYDSFLEMEKVFPKLAHDIQDAMKDMWTKSLADLQKRTPPLEKSRTPDRMYT